MSMNGTIMSWTSNSCLMPCSIYILSQLFPILNLEGQCSYAHLTSKPNLVSCYFFVVVQMTIIY